MNNQIAYEVHYRYRKHFDFANELSIDLGAIGLEVTEIKFNPEVRGCRVLIKVINCYDPHMEPELAEVVEAFDREIRDNMGGVMVYWDNPRNAQA